MPNVTTVRQQTFGSGGVSVKADKTQVYASEMTISGSMARAFVGQLTTRTSNSAGVITFTENHAFQVNDRVSFLDGTTVNLNLLVTAITSTTITFTSALSTLPALNTNNLRVGKNQLFSVASFQCTALPTPKILTKAEKGKYVFCAGPSATVSTTGNNSILKPNPNSTLDLIVDLPWEYNDGLNILGTPTTIDTLVLVNFETTSNPFTAICVF